MQCTLSIVRLESVQLEVMEEKRTLWDPRTHLRQIRAHVEGSCEESARKENV